MGVNDSDHTEQAMHLLNGVGKLVGNLKSENKENDVPIETVKKTRPVPMPSLAKFKVVGEMGSGFRPRADDVQDFYKIRDSCLASGQLFEDCEFDAVKSSLVFSKSPSISKSLDVKSIKWKRPKEIINDPQFFVKGANRFDVKQGKLGDCWLNAAVANLTLQEHLFQQVVPNDQSFQHNYAGIFHFRFWQYGHWVDVVIDDRLPTYHGNLVFMHSNEQNEFWSALLEKAYAKLHGSYEALKHGNAFEALEDFTGGVTEYFKLRDKAPSNLFKIMEKAHERSSLMSCSIYFLNDRGVIIICIGLLRNDYLQLVPINYTNFNSKLPFVYQYTIYHRTVENEQALTPEGLVRRHAYSITEIKLVDIATPNETSKIPLLRLRNPWGNKVEWNGAWSDKSPEWQRIPESVKQEMGLTFSYDGEFWMSYRDFAERFDQLEICNLSPDSLVENVLTEHDKKKWEMSVFEGEWVRGATAGGCRNYLETFWHNPQYIITLNDPDEDDEEDKCTVLVALTQKNRRKMGAKSLYIGFAVYHLEGADNLPKPLDLNFFKYNVYVAKTKSFTNQREVTARFKLPPGVYCIVPSTFEPNKEGEFLLRVFSETKNHMEENDEKVGMGEIDNRVKVEDDEPEKNKATDDDIREFFKKVAGDDMEVDWMELKQVLDYAMKTDTQPEGFSKDVCRSMIAMLDIDRSGKLGFEELKQLLVEIMTWKFVYKMYCKEETGYLSAFEMRQALNSAGYRLNNHILNILVHRYASKEGKISFDDFVMCAIRLKFMIDQFKGRDPNNTNEATFKIDEWVEMTLYS